jgi:hypothetical protein
MQNEGIRRPLGKEKGSKSWQPQPMVSEGTSNLYIFGPSNKVILVILPKTALCSRQNS